MFDVLNHPWGLVGIAVLVLLAIWGLRRSLEEKVRWWYFLLPVVIAGIGVGLDYWVQTDFERVKETIENVTEAVTREDCEAIAPFFAEDYNDGYHRSKGSFLRHCRSRLDGPLIRKMATNIVDAEIKDESAEAVMTARISFDKRSRIYNYQPLMLMKLRIWFDKTQDGRMLIRKVDLLEINNQRANWDDIR